VISLIVTRSERGLVRPWVSWLLANGRKRRKGQNERAHLRFLGARKWVALSALLAAPPDGSRGLKTDQMSDGADEP